MTAKEAREKTNKLNFPTAQEEYDKIIRLINVLIKQGHMKIDLISPEVKERLRKDGYIVEYIQDGIQECKYKISW